MILGRVIKINNKKFKDGLKCTYYSLWNGLPIYTTSDRDNVCAILNKDHSCMIVVGDVILNMYTQIELECALWHEVSHLYYRDMLDQWSINYEYRADMVAVRSTCVTAALSSLEKAIPLFKTDHALNILHRRIEQIRESNGEYGLIHEPTEMLATLEPVTVRMWGKAIEDRR